MKKINSYIFILSLAFFTLGQIPRLLVTVFVSPQLELHPLDLLVFIGAVTLILNNIVRRTRQGNLVFADTIMVFIFTFFVSLFSFQNLLELKSIIYLARFISYLIFADFIREIIGEGTFKKQQILTFLVATISAVAILGYLQYFFVPDLRSLSTVGWDNHLHRLTSTFLDPAYTGVILAAGILISLHANKETRNSNYLIAPLIIFPAFLLTYSRSSYLALFFAVIFLYKNRLNFKKTALLTLASAILLTLLPRPAGVGVKLERVHSIYLKMDNAKFSLEIISKNPLFGIGYNNICRYKELTLGQQDWLSHACGGLDNSILFIIATTGVIGLFILVNNFYKLAKNLEKKYKDLFISIAILTLIHTSFTNTLFYNYYLFLLVTIIGVSLKKAKWSN